MPRRHVPLGRPPRLRSSHPAHPAHTEFSGRSPSSSCWFPASSFAPTATSHNRRPGTTGRTSTSRQALISQVIDTPISMVRAEAGGAVRSAATIGLAAANWFRSRLDQANLAAGDIVLLASPGGDLNQAAIMGEIIRQRALATAVGSADASGAASSRATAPAPACSSMPGARPASASWARPWAFTGSHTRPRSTIPSRRPADCRRRAGLHDQDGGVVDSIVEAMSRDPGDLLAGPKQALAMNLVTDPLGKP